MARESAWSSFGILLIALLFIGSCMDDSEKAIRNDYENKINDYENKIEVAYDEGYREAMRELERVEESVREETIDEIASAINGNEYHGPISVSVTLCCPYCQTLIEYYDGDVPQIIARKGHEGWEDTCYSFVQFDY